MTQAGRNHEKVTFVRIGPDDAGDSRLRSQYFRRVHRAFDTPPSIAALQFTKDTTNLFITGSIDFLAPDVDLDTIVITAINSRGFAVSQTTTDLSAFRGLASGTIPFAIDYAVFLPDTYTFTVFVTDLAGSFSNQLVGTFSVP